MPGGVVFDVEVTKTVSPDPTVVAGQQLVFTVYVTNNGPDTADAVGVPLSDTLPPEVSFVSVSVSAPSPPANPCTHSGETSGGTITCNSLGALAPNETAIVTITTTVDPSTPGGTVITNQAESPPVPEQDTNPGNNTSNITRTTVVTPTPTPTPAPRPVGGYGEPLSTTQLLGPWMILAAGVLLAAVAAVLLTKRVVS